MSRYVERAENVARLVQVNMEFSLDAFAKKGDSWRAWRAVLQTTCTEGFAPDSPEASNPKAIARFITFDSDNADSIRSSIALARENARMVRDQIPEKMWLELNAVYLYLKNPEADRVWETDPEKIYRRIIDFSLVFQGLAEATILHDEGWRFLELGKFLERADQSSRILDMLTFKEDPGRHECSAILGACSSEVAFRVEFLGAVTLRNVAQLILFSESFPRSVRFCIRRLDETVHAISGFGMGGFSNEIERLTGRALADVNYCAIDDVFSVGLTNYIDEMQKKLNEIGRAIYETYVLVPSETSVVTRTGDPQVFQAQQQ